MKLTTRSRYAVSALAEIARNYGARLTKRKEINHNEEISDSYLEDLLVALKNGGLLFTSRGSKGGYALTRPPSKITMLDIITSQEGSLAPVKCLADSGYCHSADFCLTKKIWEIFYETIKNSLSSITLQDVIESTKDYKKKRGPKVRKFC